MNTHLVVCKISSFFKIIDFAASTCLKKTVITFYANPWQLLSNSFTEPWLHSFRVLFSWFGDSDSKFFPAAFTLLKIPLLFIHYGAGKWNFFFNTQIIQYHSQKLWGHSGSTQQIFGIVRAQTSRNWSIMWYFVYPLANMKNLTFLWPSSYSSWVTLPWNLITFFLCSQNKLWSTVFRFLYLCNGDTWKKMLIYKSLAKFQICIYVACT